jgi:hypothetical protein
MDDVLNFAAFCDLVEIVQIKNPYGLGPGLNVE